METVEIVLQSPCSREIPGHIHSANAKLVTKFLYDVKKGIIPNYVEKEVPANVSPPPETPNAMSGMNPSAIKDVNLRNRYLKAIEENSQQTQQNKKQTLLNRIHQSIEKNVANYLGVVVSTYPENRNELIAYFKQAGFSEEQIQNLIKSPR